MKGDITLADLLDRYMKAQAIGATRLSRRIDELVGVEGFVSRRSIENWRDGTAKSARDWRQMVAVAAGLNLGEDDANLLLQHAGLPSLEQLWTLAEEKDRFLLAAWAGEGATRQVADSISWYALCRAGLALTEDELGSVEERFPRPYYLQRRDLLLEIERFLESREPCLVLTGKSGVGKSSFVLSLVEQAASNEAMCLCVYNAARLAAEGSLAEKVGTDLVRRLSFSGVAGSRIWAWLDQKGHLGGKVVLVVFDAINENPQGRKLLHQIDQWVGATSFPWLKILITTRPEAWRTMRRGLRLAEHRYYHPRRRGPDDSGLEVTLPAFSVEELRLAYDGYRRWFSLRRGYDDLGSATRSALRDPLMLKFVAETFQDQEMPREIDAGDINGLYIRGLMRTQRLYEEDLAFLENSLMPLMLDWGHLTNAISAEDLRMATSHAALPLVAFLRNPDLPQEGRHVAAAYARLIDAGILTEDGPPDAYRVSFRHERLFDHFAGQRLQELLDRASQDRRTALPALMATVNDHPFLWGALQKVLAAEIDRGEQASLVALAETSDSTERRLLIEALADQGRRRPEVVHALLHRLISHPSQGESPMWQLRGRAQADSTSPAVVRSKQVAVEVAAQLAMTDILADASCDSLPIVREHALVHARILAEQHPESAVRLAATLGRRSVNRFGLPRWTAFGSFLAVSIVVGFQCRDRPQALEELKLVWRRFLDRLLALERQERGALGRMESKTRTAALLLAARVIVNIVDGLISPDYIINIAEIARFFHRSPQEVQRFERLLPYLDPDHQPWEGAYPDLEALYQSRDVLSTILVWMVLSGWGKRSFTGMMKVGGPLFDAALGLDPPGPMVVAALGAVYNAIEGQGAQNLAIYRTLESMFWRYYRHSNCCYETDLARYQHDYLDVVLVTHYELTGAAFPPGFRETMRAEAEAGTYSLQRLLFEGTEGVPTPSGALHDLVAKGCLGLALRIAADAAVIEAPSVGEGLYHFLAWHRMLYRDRIDDFVDTHGLDPHRLRRVEAALSSRQLDDIMSAVTVHVFGRVRDYPALFEQIAYLFRQLPRCRSLAQLAEVVIKQTVDSLYGEAVFAHSLPSAASAETSGAT